MIKVQNYMGEYVEWDKLDMAQQAAHIITITAFTITVFGVLLYVLYLGMKWIIQVSTKHNPKRACRDCPHLYLEREKRVKKCKNCEVMADLEPTRCEICGGTETKVKGYAYITYNNVEYHEICENCIENETRKASILGMKVSKVKRL